MKYFLCRRLNLPRSYRALSLAALLAWNTAVLAQEPADSPAAAAAPTVATTSTPTPEQLQSAWEKQELQRQAAPPRSEARAQASEAGAQLASQRAWLAFDAQRWDEAAGWFERRATLLREAYDNRRFVLEARLNTLAGQQNSARRQLRTAWANLRQAHPQLYRQIVTRLRRERLLLEPVEHQGSLAAQLLLVEEGKRLRMAGQQARQAKNIKRSKVLLTQQHVVDALFNHLAQENIARTQRFTLLSGLHILAREAHRSSDLLRFATWSLHLQRQTLKQYRTARLKAELIADQVAAVAASSETLAGVREDMALYDEALAAYREAMRLRRSLPPGHAQRTLHSPLASLGRLQQNLGNLPQAKEHYQDALRLLQQEILATASTGASGTELSARPWLLVQEMLNQIVLLNNLGSLLQEMGDFKTAREHLERALRQAQAIPTGDDATLAYVRTSITASTLSNLAAIYSSNGENARALETVQQVIAMRRSTGDDERAATALMNAAGLLWEEGQVETAKRYADQAQQLYATTQNLRGLGGALNFKASVAREENDLVGAEKYLQEALNVARQTGDRGWLASITRNLARTRLAQGRATEALQLLGQTENLDRESQSVLSAQSTLEWQGQVLEALGRPGEALERYRRSIKLLESVRATVRDQSTFSSMEGNYRVYNRMVQLLLKQKRPEEAFDYLTRARSKQLQDSLRLEQLKSPNPALQQLLSRAGVLQNRLRSAQAALESENARPAAERDESKLSHLRSVVASKQGEFLKVAYELRKTNPSYDKVITVKPTTLRAAQQDIPTDTVLVQYAPLGEQLHIFVVTRDDLKIITAPVKSDELWEHVKTFRRLIGEAQQGFEHGEELAVEDWSKQTGLKPLRDNLIALYDRLIAPIEPELAAKKTVAFIPTQLLYYVPMHALAKAQGSGLRFLIEDKEVAYLSAADVMKAMRPRDTASGVGMMAMGNPEGADLPFALQEVQSIAKVFNPAEVVSGKAATKSTLLATKNFDKRIWHFATHGFLNPAAPELSFIQLADSAQAADAQLSIGEVWGLDLSKLDLVTLSACQTALGERNPDGSEVTSLAESFSSAGAASVVASLWSVADDSTSALMAEFYKNLAAKQSKAQALQNAQRTLLKNPQYQHPFFWAPFVLMGDWR